MLMSTSSSGLLLYAALVDLLAEDFLSEEANRTLTTKDKKLAFMFVLLGGKKFPVGLLRFTSGVLTCDCSRRHVHCWRICLNDEPDEDTKERFHLSSETPLPGYYLAAAGWTSRLNFVGFPLSAAARHSPGSIETREEWNCICRRGQGRVRREKKNEKGIIEGRTRGRGDQENPHFQMQGFLLVHTHALARSSENPKLLPSFDAFGFCFFFFTSSCVR